MLQSSRGKPLKSSTLWQDWPGARISKRVVSDYTLTSGQCEHRVESEHDSGSRVRAFYTGEHGKRFCDDWYASGPVSNDNGNLDNESIYITAYLRVKLGKPMSTFDLRGFRCMKA